MLGSFCCCALVVAYGAVVAGRREQRKKKNTDWRMQGYKRIKIEERQHRPRGRPTGKKKLMKFAKNMVCISMNRHIRKCKKWNKKHAMIFIFGAVIFNDYFDKIIVKGVFNMLFTDSL